MLIIEMFLTALAEYMISLGANTLTVDIWNNTPVHHAALSGLSLSLRAKFVNGLSVELISGTIWGDTGSTDLLQLLLQVPGSEAALEIANCEGETPLDIAVDAKNTVMAQLIQSTQQARQGS